MLRSLRVIVAGGDQDTLDSYRLKVAATEYTVIGETTSGEELVRLCAGCQPDVAVIDSEMHHFDGVQVANAIAQIAAIPVILVSSRFDGCRLDRPGLSGVMAYLIKPITADCLRASIGIAVRRFQEFHALVVDAAEARHALHDRKTIERAKGILMQHANLSES